jgi:hypothetical protein
MLLEALLSFLYFRAMHVSVGRSVCYWWLFFSFFSLLPKKKYGLTLFIADISTLVLILLISNFFILALL